LRLHDYSASGNCYKVRLLLALLGTPYERVPVDIFAGETLTPEYGALNPLRETPVLELSSGESVAQSITQSNAILWYLAEGTDYLPPERLERAQVVQWLSFEQERLMPGVGGTRFRRLTGRAVLDPSADARRFETGRQALEVLDAHLAGRQFVVGDGCSIADLSLFAYTHVADDAGFQLAGFPAVTAWLGQVRSLHGFVDDLVPYPENALPGRGRSIYD
jgi:glutathione S-transferase